jgi:hypothetical protein
MFGGIVGGLGVKLDHFTANFDSSDVIGVEDFVFHIFWET